jgi:hypothetical protein
MILALGIILFIIGCCVSSYEDNAYESQIRADRRHKELMRALVESKEIAPKKAKRTQRRIAKDKEGNLLAEEIIEEIEQ